MGTLKVKRLSSAVGLIVGWDVILDGKKVGKLKNGKTIELEISPGAHYFYVLTPQWDSNEVSFTIEETHPNAVIECSIAKQGSKVATAAAFGVIGSVVANARADRMGENQINAVLIE